MSEPGKLGGLNTTDDAGVAAGGAPAWLKLVAFAIIYFVWGTTYYAIRVGVRAMPPLLMAALRFLAAGGALFVWTQLRGERAPSGREWRSAVALALLFFLLDYGLVFWAETRVPSGLTAVMLATIPAFMAVSEITLLKTQRLTPRLGLGLAIGIAGVAVLVSRSLGPSLAIGRAPIDTAGAVALLVAPASFALASVLTRKLPLPQSKTVSSGAQMLAGGVLLGLAAAGLGEFRGFHFSQVSAAAWWALAYLVVAGSIVAFTAYVWLLHHESPTKVGTYAYVNPVVAVGVGYFLGGEALGLRTILGTAFILASVLVIALAKAQKVPQEAPSARSMAESGASPSD